MGDCDWVEVDNEDDEWELPVDVPLCNPVPRPWCPFYTRINLTISFTIVKQFSQTVEAVNTPIVRTLTSTYNEDDVKRMLEVINEKWKPASIQFKLNRYKTITPSSNYPYVQSNWFDSLDRIIRPREQWDFNAKINIFVIPYINEEVVGVFNGWGAIGVGQQGFIYISEHSSLTLDKKEPLDLGHVTAHEIGHKLGLDHHPQFENFMYADDEGQGNKMTPEQIAYARAYSSTIKTPTQDGYRPTRFTTRLFRQPTLPPYTNLRHKHV